MPQNQGKARLWEGIIVLKCGTCFLKVVMYVPLPKFYPIL